MGMPSTMPMTVRTRMPFNGERITTSKSSTKDWKKVFVPDVEVGHRWPFQSEIETGRFERYSLDVAYQSSSIVVLPQDSLPGVFGLLDRAEVDRGTVKEGKRRPWQSRLQILLLAKF